MRLEQLRELITNNTTDGSVNFNEVLDGINQETNSLMAREKEKRKSIIPHSQFLTDNGFESEDAFKSFVADSKSAAEKHSADLEALSTQLNDTQAKYDEVNGTLKNERLQYTALSVGVNKDMMSDFLKLVDPESENIEQDMQTKLKVYPSFGNVSNFGRTGGNPPPKTESGMSNILERAKNKHKLK